MSPLSRRVEEAAHGALRNRHDPSKIGPADFFEQSASVRSKFASLINVTDPDRIAIIASTSYGIATVAKNIRFTSDNNIVLLAEQFPSNVYSWRRIQLETGAQIRTAEVAENRLQANAESITDEVCRLIDEDTAVASLPVVHWATGMKLDLHRIRRRCDECQCLLVIDGTQSVGALPFDVCEIRPDAVICAGYKWLFGPYGSGLAYLGPHFDEGVPIEENWITREGSEHFGGLVQYTDSYQPAAIRFDVGQRSDFVNIAMLDAGLDHLIEWGVENVQA
ncbi:MAG: aminotransferase class V-fold PLP-dependent enzyme, partial [Rhodothermales bacterium]|nr:aminotransferase class V-fold PLP-dependent enzyme [Rhodothermales bacterium]